MKVRKTLLKVFIEQKKIESPEYKVKKIIPLKIIQTTIQMKIKANKAVQKRSLALIKVQIAKKKVVAMMKAIQMKSQMFRKAMTNQTKKRKKLNRWRSRGIPAVLVTSSMAHAFSIFLLNRTTGIHC